MDAAARAAGLALLPVGGHLIPVPPSPPPGTQRRSASTPAPVSRSAELAAAAVQEILASPPPPTSSAPMRVDLATERSRLAAAQARQSADQALSAICDAHLATILPLLEALASKSQEYDASIDILGKYVRLAADVSVNSRVELSETQQS